MSIDRDYKYKLVLYQGTNNLDSPSLTLAIPTFKPLTADITADFDTRNKMVLFLGEDEDWCSMTFLKKTDKQISQLDKCIRKSNLTLPG